MVKIIVGMMGSSVAKGSTSMATVEQVQTFLRTVSSHGVTELDTARVYNSGRSEELLGLSNARNTFSISTKAPAFSPGSLSEPAILSNASASLAALQQDKLDIYYLHGPDRSTPLDQQCRAIAQLHRANRFARFGVSNISAADVQTIHDICVREGVPPPTVYQGGYNPLNRRAEEGLFPTLRKLGIAFYAFSPLAGGALAKPVDEVLKPKEGTRFAEMPVFGTMYAGEEMVRVLRRQTELCEKHGFGIMEGTLRWFMHHSPLGEEDGFILGASSTEQIEASLKACEKPPLPEEVVAGWDQLWEAARENAPEYYPK
jgi:aflatoxin B1 aldehyde reductase